MVDGVDIWDGMSAAQARANGHPVPANVPDCATLTLELDSSSVQAVDEGQRLPTIKFSVRTKWSWCTVTGIVDIEGPSR